MPARDSVTGQVMPKRRSAPYPFILEALAPLEPEVRPMFSGFAVYVGEKIVLMLRDSLKQPRDNGVWLVFSETANLADPVHPPGLSVTSSHRSAGRQDRSLAAHPCRQRDI